MKIKNIYFLFIGVFLFSQEVSAQQFTCANTSSWESLATNSTPFDYHSSPIKPDGSPSYQLSTADLFHVIYPNVSDVEIIYTNTSECYAGVTCSSGTGYDFSQSFPVEHPAWTNVAQCSCSHAPQSGCNAVTTYRLGNPSLISGPVGSPYPAFPTPVFPASWSERYIYSHTYMPEDETLDGVIQLGINSRTASGYPGSDSTTATKCSEDIVTVGGEEYTRKFFLLTGMSNHDQSIKDLKTPEQHFIEDWGICGTVDQYWLASPALNVSWGNDVRNIPIIAYVSDTRYEYVDRGMCSAGSYLASLDKCVQTQNPNNNACPAGYTYISGGFGYGPRCRLVTPSSPQPCLAGYTIDPFDSTQCRIAVASTPVGTGVPVTPVQGSGGGNVPSWCTATGDVWNDATLQCTYGTQPTVSCAEGFVWDSSSLACLETQNPGGGSGISTPVGGQGEDDFFNQAPNATPGKVGTNFITADGFYTPTYGDSVSFVSLTESKFASFGIDAMTSPLDALAPPVFAGGGLPRMCLDLTFIGSQNSPCFDFMDYSWVFDVIKIFFYFVAVVTSWRIIIGAR